MKETSSANSSMSAAAALKKASDGQKLSSSQTMYLYQLTSFAIRSIHVQLSSFVQLDRPVVFLGDPRCHCCEAVSAEARDQLGGIANGSFESPAPTVAPLPCCAGSTCFVMSSPP